MPSPIPAIARYTVMESMRNRLLLLCLLLAGTAFVLIEFIGELTITEHRLTQVALLAAFLRISAVLVVALFVVSGTVRELHDKTLEMILAMPVHRASYYLGKLAGYSVIALLVCLIFAGLLLFYADTQALLVWAASLFLELLLVVALALVMLFSFSQVPAALAAVFVFYGAARIVGTIFLISQSPIIAHDSAAQKFMDGFIELLTWLLPDLHRFTRSEWLAYNTADWSALLPLLGQTLVYLCLLAFIALFDFYRKNF
ncbi:MAG TPA: ABC transporter permease [Gammaproteobacteria bacterium]|nr:ABC transporter permease [Gammaproteobacteria bacterium]